MSRAIGVAASLGAGLCLATGGIGLRWVENASGWQILFWRGLALAAFIFIWMGFRYRRELPQAVVRIGRTGLFAAGAIGLAATCYVFAIYNTTVANTVVIISLSPLLAAVMARVVLGELVTPASMVALLVAVGGVAVMFADGMNTGGTLGIVIALGAVTCFSAFVVSLRAGRAVDMMPAICLSGVLVAMGSMLLADSILLGPRDMTIGIALGVVQLGCGYACLAIATRHIKAALVSVLALSEVVFAPLFVWIGVGEAPSAQAAVGGAVVVLAVGFQALYAARETSP